MVSNSKRAKAKQHFFTDLDLNAVITPSTDAAGAFTSAFYLHFKSSRALPGSQDMQ